MQLDVKVISSNCDFMFDMFFKDTKALEDFSTSPEHLAVVASLKPYMTGFDTDYFLEKKINRRTSDGVKCKSLTVND